MNVVSLHVYPVKGARGIALQAADVLASGLRHDRRFMVLDQNGHFVTQREHPQMALVETSISRTSSNVDGAAHTTDVVVSFDGKSAVLSPGTPESWFIRRRKTTVWDDEVEQAVDIGGEGAAFFSDLLKEKCAVVYMPLDVIRQVDLKFARTGDRVGFADGFPVLVASLASLNDLNKRLVANGASPVPIDRFRASIVIDGDESDPYAEDRAPVMRVRVGGEQQALRLRMPKRCARCQVITIDQQTAAESKEPLRTLASYRTDANKVNFAMNAIPDLSPSESRGIAVGDPVFFEEA